MGPGCWGLVLGRPAAEAPGHLATFFRRVARSRSCRKSFFSWGLRLCLGVSLPLCHVSRGAGPGLAVRAVSPAPNQPLTGPLPHLPGRMSRSWPPCQVAGTRLKKSPKRPAGQRSWSLLPNLSYFLGHPAPSTGLVQQSLLPRPPFLPGSAGHLATLPLCLPRGRTLSPC